MGPLTISSLLDSIKRLYSSPVTTLYIHSLKSEPVQTKATALALIGFSKT